MYRKTSDLGFLWKSDEHGDSWQCMDAHESGEIEEQDHVRGTERGNIGRWKKMTESLGEKEKTGAGMGRGRQRFWWVSEMPKVEESKNP